MSGSISLDKIKQAITEIENCRIYNSANMKSAKENWLSILYDARDRYESLKEDDFQKINFALCIHYLNYSQIMFQKEMASAVSIMAKTLETIIDKQIKSENSSTNMLEEKNDDIKV